MHSLIHSFLTAGLEYKSSKNVNVVKMKKNTTCPLSSFPAQMLFRSYITVDVSSLMLGCLNCNYANTDCPLTRRIDNSTALAATARYGYGYLTLNMLGKMCESLLLGSLCRYETTETSLDLKCRAFIMMASES